MPRYDGIDVSHYQAVIDWRAVRASGVWWAGTKATQGNAYVDPTMQRNRLGMKQSGMRHRLLYHWLSPTITADAQAAHFLATVGALEIGEGVMLDAEEVGITATQALRWCQLIEAATRRPVAVYTGAFVAGGTIWRSTQIFDGRRARVLAAYTSETHARQLAAPFVFDAWQWTSTAHVAGITPSVDVDQIDHPEIFDQACALAVVPTTPPDLRGIMRNAVISVAGEPAIFTAVVNDQGAALDVSWSGPGASAVARLDAHRAAGAVDLTVTRADLHNCILRGPIPDGWSAADFYRVDA